MKIAAIRQLGEIGEATPERFFVYWLRDASFDVAREAYVALRTAVAREPRDPVERKLFPRFPRHDDAFLTPAAIPTLQDEVGVWWKEYLVERRALLKARGDRTTKACCCPTFAPPYAATRTPGIRSASLAGRSATASTLAAEITSSCSSAVRPGYSGSDRTSLAARSVSGNSPGIPPRWANAG